MLAVSQAQKRPWPDWQMPLALMFYRQVYKLIAE